MVLQRSCAALQCPPFLNSPLQAPHSGWGGARTGTGRSSNPTPPKEKSDDPSRVALVLSCFCRQNMTAPTGKQPRHRPGRGGRVLRGGAWRQRRRRQGEVHPRGRAQAGDVRHTRATRGVVRKEVRQCRTAQTCDGNWRRPPFVVVPQECV